MPAPIDPGQPDFDNMKPSDADKIDISGASVEDRTAEHKRTAVIGLIDDVKRQGEDIDRLNKSMEYVAKKLTPMAETMDKLVDVVNQLVKGGGAAAPGNDPKAMLGDLLNSPLGEKLLNKLMPEQQAAQPLISNEDIQKRVIESFWDDLDTGKNIRNYITGALKKNATRTIINTSLKDIGQQNIGPDPHGPA